MPRCSSCGQPFSQIVEDEESTDRCPTCEENIKRGETAARGARQRFEETVFNYRFLKSICIKPNGLSPVDLSRQSEGCPTLAEFCRKDDNGNYLDPFVAGAWWQWASLKRNADRWKRADWKRTPENHKRADLGSAAVDQYPDRANDDDEGAITSMLANILHFAAQQGIDPHRMVRVAVMHYEHEEGGE